MISERSCWIAVVVLLLVPWIGHFTRGHGEYLSGGAAQEDGLTFRRQPIDVKEHAEPAPAPAAVAPPAPTAPVPEVVPATAAPYVVPYFAPPSYAEFCGEPVPLDNQEVRERFDREFTIVVYAHSQVYLWLKRMERYFPWVEHQLAMHKLPDDLKYLAVAESDLNTTAVSSAGAVGPWQFISSTGLRYGLNQSTGLDQRCDFELATSGAFRYLSDLHRLFDNWTLAAAGYNCGEKRVQDEMARQKVGSYYQLKLPLETERYVFRILAIKEVLSRPEKYGYVLPKGGGYPPFRVDHVSVNTTCPVPVQALAESAGTTYRQIKRLNPAFTSDTIPSGSHRIKVPEGKGPDVEARIQALRANRLSAIAPSPPASVSHKDVSRRIVSHKVARGETLSGIAERYEVSSADLRRWNGIKGDRVKVGQVLKINR